LNANAPNFDNNIKEGLLALTSVHGLTFRSIERVVSNIVLLYAASTQNSFRIAPYVIGLSVMKSISPKLYADARKGLIDTDVVMNFMQFDKWENYVEHVSSEWHVNWWKYATVINLPENEDWVEQASSTLFTFNFRDRKYLLPHVASLMDNLQQM